MILIADSGSTKTDWSVIRDGRLTKSVQTKGINPYFQSREEIGNEISKVLLAQLENAPLEAVYFYGAGCTFDKVEVVCNAIGRYTHAARVEVNTDLLAAARSVCGHEAGIACILGTGSNTCFYDGIKIVDNISPLGFILGDEGSGAVLGKLLVGDLLKGMMGQELRNKFLTQYNLTPGEIIDRVYRQPFPNRFLASLTPFLAENLHEPKIHELLLNSFRSFITRNVWGYDYGQYTVSFVGSIAWHFKGILAEAAAETGIRIGRIIRSPMEGLITYHTSQLKTNKD